MIDGILRTRDELNRFAGLLWHNAHAARYFVCYAKVFKVVQLAKSPQKIFLVISLIV